MKYLPDTPKEYAFVGSALARLGTAISGGLILDGRPLWALLTIGLTWLGHEVNGYFKLQETGEDVNEKL